jgi:hypothetical protein
MDNAFRIFYRNFYFKTGGFIPSAPLNQNLYPGDFFQIVNGEMLVLGNIFQKGIVHKDDVEFGYGLKLNPASWEFSDGLSKPYSGRGSGQGTLEDFEFSKQILAFEREGSFFFKATDPVAARILNWNDLQQELIIKMTQTYYSFRDLYIVTEVASTADWTLAVAGSKKAELEISTDSENFGLVDIFGHHSAKTIQSKDIEYYHREAHKKPVFFKAKKLVVQDDKLNVFISDLITTRENQHQWAGSFFDYDFHFEPSYSPQIRSNSQASLLDMLQANQLNPNTALLYFRWGDANLDDIEKLFISYGEE